MAAGEQRLEELNDTECRELLAGHEFGRLAVVVEDELHIFPVNYVYDGDGIVVHTDAGTKLRGATLRRVAFEIDEVDPGPPASGWSVVARGVGNDITDAIDKPSERARALPLSPWVGERSQLMRISPIVLDGRRLV